MIADKDRKYSDPFWFENDIENMQYMFEYCDDYLYEIYKLRGLNKIKFINIFMKSELRAAMEKGEYSSLYQAAFDTFRTFIREDHYNDPSIFLYKPGEKQRKFRKYQMWWIGEQYSYIHYMEDMPSATLIDKLPVEFMIDCFKLGHELSTDGFYQRVKWKLKEKTE